jgi:hypothetical protein
VPFNTSDPNWLPPRYVYTSKMGSMPTRAVDSFLTAGSYMMGELEIGDDITLTLVRCAQHFEAPQTNIQI